MSSVENQGSPDRKEGKEKEEEESSSTKKSPSPLPTNDNDNTTNNDATTTTNDEVVKTTTNPKDLAKSPLAICPTCNKTLASLKSLYGHHGRSHRTSVERDKIKFACPFCDDVPSFDALPELRSHAEESHPTCTLILASVETSVHAEKKGAASSSSSSSANASAAERRGSSRHNSALSDDDDAGGSNNNNNTTTTDKPPKQRHSHPLCKCPNCPKILLPQGLFGHFGRVHSGQLGHLAKFEWKNVAYVCPFCKEDNEKKKKKNGSDDKDKEEPYEPHVFRSIELAEAHVAECHYNCHLTRPNALIERPNKRSGPAHLKTDNAVGSTSVAASRKSQRGGGGRRTTTTIHATASALFGGDDDDDEDDIINADINDAEHAKATRKSQRSRRSVDSGVMITDEGACGRAPPQAKQPKAAPAAAAASLALEEEIAAKTLYDCPECDKKNLTKNGLHAHYGMKHGGKLDMSKVKAYPPPKPPPKKNPAPRKAPKAKASRTGPWSEAEHEAFMEGHARYGNRWKKISVEHVPTRDAKQIGSHALNFFTQRGVWQGGGRAGARGSTVHGNGSGGKKPPQDRGYGSGKKSPRRPSTVVVSSTPMDADGGYDEEGSIGSGSNSANAKSKDAASARESKTDSKADAKNQSPPDKDDDGNSSHCIACFEGGNIVCCSKCPRAYHPKCLARDGGYGGIYNVELLPNDWQCNRCKRDNDVLAGEEIGNYAFGNKRIRAAYCEFKDCGDYGLGCTLLSNILDIVNKLKNYDYGYVFSEAVDAEDVPDYHQVVKTPMDYGTIIQRLESGNYVDLIASDDVSRDGENSTMEEILLHVLCDVERVHHNCHLYNKEGSSIFRAGDVHVSKWNAYFGQYILEKLPENVQRDLTLFRHRCELEFKEGSQRKRTSRIKNLKEAEEKKKKRHCDNAKSNTAAPSTILSPTVNQKKRKASSSVPPGEEEDEEDLEDEEHGEPHYPTKKPRKKAKPAAESHGHSTALLFTKDQMRSLENIFFSSAAKLREEFGDLDAVSSCNNLTLMLSSSSPSAHNDDVKNNDKPTASTDGNHIDIPSASSGGGDGDGGDVSMKENAKSEESMQSTPKTSVVSPSATAPTLLTIPAVITSGPVFLETAPALPMTASSCSTPTSGMKESVDVDKISSAIQNSKETNPGGAQGTTFQRQWYERLDEMKKYKIIHGTAVVSATKNDKLYHWRLRQRKRYHLTLFRMSHLKREYRGWDSEFSQDKKDKEWLLAMPEMKGVFSLSAVLEDGNGGDNAPKPVTIKEKDVELDEKTVDIIRKKHQEQLYCPPLIPMEFLGSQSTRHSISLFWDECLEELRFFQGDHQHTLVPRDFPYNSLLPVWVEIQRARFLLQSVGIFSGLTGSQMLVLDELNLFDLSSLPTVDNILAGGSALTINTATTASHSSSGKKIGMNNKTKPDSGPSPERKSWSTYVSDFKEWFHKLSPDEKLKASEILPRANWSLYSWCWRQCNAASAVLCGTPNITGINMSVRKLNVLASAHFFQVFCYNDRHGLVREDDYEGCDAFDSTFQVLEDFSIKYGSTHIPAWYDCDRAFRMWVSALENGLSEFVKGEPCVLSIRQIEKLILIGFCNDRERLPNLSRGDVVWLKMYVELKRHCTLFGVCNVTSHYPRLHHWIAEQKELFRLSRMGTKDMMNSSRLKMLMEAGVDFFTGECLPGMDNLIQKDHEEFESMTSSPVESFPVNERLANIQTNYGWTFQNDNYWKNLEYRAKFEHWKVKNGHSIVLASDDQELYWWFVEKRGKALLSELTDSVSSQVTGSNELRSHSILHYITAQKNEDDTGSTNGNVSEDTNGADQSMFLWLLYCERLMLFKARKGHCKIPKNYPDKPLQRWLSQQQELIHLYSTGIPTEMQPVQLRVLFTLGVHGSKRSSSIPKLSSRTLKRKYPSKRVKSNRDSDKSKKD